VIDELADRRDAMGVVKGAVAGSSAGGGRDQNCT
jgi:hypothetical protein